MDDSHAYDDIINLPHHVSGRHPQMSAAQRAMQFASYKALAGYEDMIEETGRLTDFRPDLAEDQKEALDDTLQQLNAQPDRQICVTWFCPDERKDGGAIRTAQGHLKKVDTLRRVLTLIPAPQAPSVSDDRGLLPIPLDDICHIEILM